MDTVFINKLIKERDELEIKLNQINELIEKFGKSEGRSSNKPSSSKVITKELTGGNLTSVVTELFKSESRFLHVREIADLLEDQGYFIGDHKEFCNKKLSPLLSRLKKDDVLVNYAVNGKNTGTFWGSPKWLDAKGVAKDGHGHNHKYIITKPQVEI